MQPRNGTLRNVYIQWPLGFSQVGLKPTENSCLARVADVTLFGNLPATVIEALGGAAAALDSVSSVSSVTLASLQVLTLASTTVAAQYASRPVRMVIVEVGGWENQPQAGQPASKQQQQQTL